ncbi:MAG: hypothetical protein ACRDK5_05855 [Solirubrobacterales bacterium]
MGILDDAIREHLDLKRKHGARDSEISEIEDEALGSGDRPDPFAAGELFGEVSAPGAPAPDAPEQALGRSTPPPDGLEEPPLEGPTALVEPSAAAPEPPPAEPAAPERPSASEPPAESESLEELMAQEEETAPPEGAEVAVPPPPPPETEAAARPEPPMPPPPAATEGQRGRARGRADVPTQEHIPPPRETGEAAPVPSEPEAPEEGAPQLYDFETDPGLVEEEGADLGIAPAPPEASDDFETLGPVEEAKEAEEDLYLDEEEPYGEQRGGTTDFEEVEAVEEDYKTEVRPADNDEEVDDERYRTEVRPADPEEEEDEEDDDLLSESPEFLDQDADESLWFEKGPPKDFDFEDEDEDEDD